MDLFSFLSVQIEMLQALVFFSLHHSRRKLADPSKTQPKPENPSRKETNKTINPQQAIKIIPTSSPGDGEKQKTENVLS